MTYSKDKSRLGETYYRNGLKINEKELIMGARGKSSKRNI